MFEQYARAVAEAGADVDRLAAEAARAIFPQFRFENVAGVLLDHTAGLIAAAETIGGLVQVTRAAGARFLERTAVRAIDPTGDPIIVETNKGRLRTRRLVVTAGAWTERLLPFLRPELTVVRQTVGYFQIAGPPDDYDLGKFPVWVYLEDGENNVFYGLPQFGRAGVKFARHRTQGSGDDPDQAPAEFSESAKKDLLEFGRQNFANPIEAMIGFEFCLYTNTADEDFVIDLHPDDPRIAIGAGFSGHGFKFGPLTGRVLAELVVEGRTAVGEFERIADRFRIRRADDPARE